MAVQTRKRSKKKKTPHPQSLRMGDDIHKDVKVYAAQKSLSMGPAIGRLLSEHETRVEIDRHVAKTAKLLSAWSESEQEYLDSGVASVSALFQELARFLEK